MARKRDARLTPTTSNIEPILLEASKDGVHAMRMSTRYAKETLGVDLREWDAKVLRGEYHPTVTAEYALATKGGQWDDLEKAVAETPDDDEWSRSVVVEYAQRVLSDRWQEQEGRLVASARHLYDYAERVVGGRLPDELHEAMGRHRVLTVDPEERNFVDEYFGKYGD